MTRYRFANFLSIGLLASTMACASPEAPVDDEQLTEAPTSPDLGALQKTPPGFQIAEVLHVMTTPQGYAVLLGDAAEEQVVPIFIGETEAMAIHLRMERRRYERPLTHDLLDDILARLGADVVKVHIDGLKTGVFVGTVFIATSSVVMQFDARSSDAIAIAIGNEVPIFIADEVVDVAGISRDEIEQQPMPETEGDRGPPTESL